jgi:hypothetical protein
MLGPFFDFLPVLLSEMLQLQLGVLYNRVEAKIH